MGIKRRRRYSRYHTDFGHIYRQFVHLPLHLQLLLEFLLVLLLTNHTAITDLINLVKVIRWW
jgi:hypothetical protein